ncbi:MAG: VOC family protein [Phycisphaeraceae bacterium]|nr:VOC family protein [Phycisphaeraceae bacterium]
MITGVHTLIYTRHAEQDRAFFRDALGWPAVDAGQGWLIFAMPPGELAFHPADEGEELHRVWLMCDSIGPTLDLLRSHGAREIEPVADHGWGLVSSLETPAGTRLSIYEPRHPTALDRA